MVWQRRWVVLTGCRMTYYKDKEESIRPQGTIWLVGIKVVPRTDSNGATSIALLHAIPGMEQKERMLCGETRRMNELWLEAINQAHAAAEAKGSHQGYLWVKLGPAAGKKQVWRRRWVVLDGVEETLYTFAAPDESDHKEEFNVTGSRLRNVARKGVQLGNFSSEYQGGDIDPFPFGVHLMSGQDVVLCAESRSDEQSWRHAIGTCAEGGDSLSNGTTTAGVPVVSPMYQQNQGGLDSLTVDGADGEKRLSSGDETKDSHGRTLRSSAASSRASEEGDRSSERWSGASNRDSSAILDIDEVVDDEDAGDAVNLRTSDFGDAMYEGDLLKKGGGTSVVGRRNWKKRYFVLYLDHLVYYKEKGGTPLGQIALSGCELRIVTKTKYDWHFVIETPNMDGGRTFQLRATSKESFENWRDYLSASL